MTVIDDYLEKVREPQKSELERIRAIVKQTLPEAEEVISYGMPAFKYNKKYLIGFAPFKDHLSLFPTAGPVEALQSKLSGLGLSKGTIRFMLEQPLSEQLIKEILSVRIADINKK